MLYIHVAKLCFEKYWIHQYADYITCEDICMSAPLTHASLTAIPKIGIYRVVCQYKVVEEEIQFCQFVDVESQVISLN